MISSQRRTRERLGIFADNLSFDVVTCVFLHAIIKPPSAIIPRGGLSTMSLVTGLHHITVCAGGAQEDVDFLTQVFGQRLIKQTILFDGRYAHYHLYYA